MKKIKVKLPFFQKFSLPWKTHKLKFEIKHFRELSSNQMLWSPKLPDGLLQSMTQSTTV